jgi:hypothetical protein
VSWVGEFFRDDGSKTIHNPSQQRLVDPFKWGIGSVGCKQIQNGWQSMVRDLLLEQMSVPRVADGMSDSE